MRKVLYLLLLIITFGCEKEKAKPTYDTAKLVDKWWYLPYSTGTINHRFNTDATADIFYDYDYAINGGINYKWKGRNDSLIVLAGVIYSFSEYDKYKVISITDSVLTLSKDGIQFMMYDK